MKIAYVAHVCPGYRISTFEMLGTYHDVDFYFYAADKECYPQRQQGMGQGRAAARYIPGFNVGETRIAPALISRLLFGDYDVYIKCMNGRFAVLFTYLVARIRRKPFVLWSGIWMRLRTPSHRLFFPLTRYIYRHANAVVVFGEHGKRYWVSEGVLPERIFVAPHSVNNIDYARIISADAQAALLRKLGLAPDQKVVLYMGRLEQSRGLPYLLEAFAALRRDDTVLVFAGAGSAAAWLRDVADQAGIGRQVRFAGYVSHAEAIRYYALARVSVLPSITLPTGNETWGLGVNMAFNQGVPIVATEAVGAVAAGMVQHGVNGFVVPERNSAAIAGCPAAASGWSRTA